MSPQRSSLQDAPAYRAAEAARMLALPAGTVKAWCFGQDYPRRAGGGRKQFHRVIEPADPSSKLLSFANLCELHVLGVIRRVHRVGLPRVRQAVAFLQRQLGVSRPLVTESFLTNGIDLFVEHAGELLNVSEQGQQALRADFERALERIRFDVEGRPVRLFPYSREVAPGVTQPNVVLVDPALSFGRPVVDGAYVRTEVIEQRFRAGDTIAEIAEDCAVPASVIEEALRFESRLAA